MKSNIMKLLCIFFVLAVIRAQEAVFETDKRCIDFDKVSQSYDRLGDGCYYYDKNRMECGEHDAERD